MRPLQYRGIWLPTSALLACLVIAELAVCSVGAQGLNPSARDLLSSPRQLVAAEIPVVLSAVRAAVAGKTLRLAYAPGLPGPEILMGTNGRPRFVQATSGYDVGAASGSRNPDGSITRAPFQVGHVDLITFTEYTERLARKCDGPVLGGNLVIQYEHRSTDNQWTVQARTRQTVEELSPPFDMLAGAVVLETGGQRQIGDRMARALVAPFKLAEGTQPLGPITAGMTQSLWIDVASLLPLRWSISVPADPARGVPAIPDYGLSFTYDTSINLRPPDGVAAPDCVR